MVIYESNFDVSIIPHISEGGSEIIDNIHNYPNRNAPKERQVKSDLSVQGIEGEGVNLMSETKAKKNLEKAPKLSETSVRDVLRKEIAHPRIARLIGLVSHLAYWSVFG